MSEDNGKPSLSFAERLAKAKQETDAKAKQPAAVSVSSAESKINNKPFVYFHSSIAGFRFIVGPGKKANFKDHFFITDDSDEIAVVRKDFVSKTSGHVRVTEVSEYFYQAARMIQPEILPIPLQQEDQTLQQQEQKLDNS
jgi:hypothetical protein